MSDAETLLVQREATIAEQTATIESLVDKLAKLEHYVAQLLRERYGRRSEQLDPQQRVLFELEGDSLPAPPAKEIAVQSHRRKGGGRLVIPDHLPRKIIEHDLPASEKSCPCCGTERLRIGFDKSEQLDLVPASIFVLEHRRWKYACRACEEEVAIAAAPPKPIAKGLAAPGLLAAIGVGKFSEHLPLYRQEDILFRQGVNLPRSTLCRWVIEAAQLLQPFYELLKSQVLQSKVIHTDDTPVKVLDRLLSQTRTGRFWVYCGDHMHPYTVYDYTASRKRDGPAALLGDYAGYLQADAFAGYDGIYAGGSVIQVLCWAHARRKFFEAKESSPTLAHVALGFIARLYAVEKPLNQISYRLDNRDQIEDAILKWYRARREARQREALPILHEFRLWLAKAQGEALPKSPLGQAIGYILPRWESFTRYCDKGFLNIDNNLSERMVRPVAIGRKNFLFLGNDRGGHAAAVWYSLIATAKANHVEPWAWCRALLQRLAELGAEPTPELLLPLLPQKWLAENPKALRRWAR
jgi:transposase